MKIVRMWDREERGGYQFAMVREQWFWFWGRDRRIGRGRHANFAYLDTGKFTPGSQAEDLWDSKEERPLGRWEKNAKKLQAAYLVGCDKAKE